MPIEFKVSANRFLIEYHKRIAKNAIEDVEWFIDEDNNMNAYIPTPTKVYFYKEEVSKIPGSVLTEGMFKVEGEVRGIVEIKPTKDNPEIK